MTSAQGETSATPETGSTGSPLADSSSASSTGPESSSSLGPVNKQSEPTLTDTSGIDDTARINPGDPLYEMIHSNDRKGTARIPAAGRMPAAPLGRGLPLEERKAAYRHWLQERSKDELIELIVSLEGREPDGDQTEKVTTRLRPEEATPTQSSEGYQVPDDLAFVRLPVVRKTGVNEPTPTWQIVLVPLEQNTRPIGLQIDSEVSIGRTSGDASPDLDLTPYGAKTKGVSRVHARLRPEVNSLLLFDNDSSNGTFWNRIRLPAQTDRLLRDGDVITFGRLTFLLKIVKAPNTNDAKTLL